MTTLAASGARVATVRRLLFDRPLLIASDLQRWTDG
jgi:hypothetical protein